MISQMLKSLQMLAEEQVDWGTELGTKGSSGRQSVHNSLKFGKKSHCQRVHLLCCTRCHRGSGASRGCELQKGPEVPQGPRGLRTLQRHR